MNYKVLITLFILGLIFFLITLLFSIQNNSFTYTNNKDVNTNIEIKSEMNKQTQDEIPKVVYCSYYNIDMIPSDIIENLKRYCQGYTINIYRHQSCEDFLYNYYNSDFLKLFKELDSNYKSIFWALCKIYVNGGYYLNINKKFVGHINNQKSFIDKLNISYKGKNIIALAAKPKSEEIWNLIINYFSNNMSIPQKENIFLYDVKTQVYNNFPLTFISNVDELIYRHTTLPPVDIKKIDIPVLYINMDKDKERRKFMESQLEGIENVIRIPGVLVTDDQNLPSHTVSNGELGCAMAHRNAWKTFIDNDFDKVLILEDDACLKLSSRWRENLSHISSPCFLAQGTTGYILDRPTAQYLIEEFENSIIDIGVDSWMWVRLYGNDGYNISPENIGYSNKVNRTCHTLYYIYAYNAVEEIPTSITDRSYGTKVRDRYSEIANLLIKRSPQVGALTIFPDGNTHTYIQRPRVALLNLEKDMILNLLKSYDNNYDLHIYKNNISIDSKKVFENNSKFFPEDFDIVIAPDFIGYNSVLVEEEMKIRKYYIDSNGFPIY